MISSGSHEVLNWFAARPTPAFGLFGRRHRVDIASIGPDSTVTISHITRHLIELGHQRIVMLSRKARRLPSPAQVERAFLEEIEASGLAVGAYNLPDWEETRKGLDECLDSLFHLTAPTVLIVHEAPQFTAVLRYLAKRGIRIPEDLSLICTDSDRSFSRCEPPISHISWDISQAGKRLVLWDANVTCGKEDRRQSHIKAEFIQGGTIGPAPKRK